MKDNSDLRKKKKGIRNIGLFSVKHWFGMKPDGSERVWLYYHLTRIGFRETIWQIVYKGQDAGLIYSLNRGENEIHVRFYSSHIEAELETGRDHIGHFFEPRYPAEHLVLKLLEPTLNADDLNRARRLFRKDNSTFILTRHATYSRIRFCTIAKFLLYCVCLMTIDGLVIPQILGLSLILYFCFRNSMPKYSIGVEKENV